MKFTNCYRVLCIAVAVAMVITVAACSKSDEKGAGVDEEVGEALGAEGPQPRQSGSRTVTRKWKG